MKWTYIIKNKLLASGALFSLCILVLLSNYIDRTHSENVKNSISTLYEDRLIAEGNILKMTSGVYQIKEVLNANISDNEKIGLIGNLIITIREESNAYQKTKFTQTEKTKAAELLRIFPEFESNRLNNLALNIESANKALILLNELSAIQFEESKQIMDRAEALYLTGKTSSQFIFAIIIMILLVLQALVFTSKTLLPATKTKLHNLN